LRVTRLTGTSVGLISALALLFAWFCSGPYFHYSESWLTFINTVTGIITFLMVFLIQRAQNKDTQALHIKLNELIASQKGASNQLLHVEEKTEAELEELRELQRQLPVDTTEAHSIANAVHSPIVLPYEIRTH
jgi:low affinity Fe/Cu permease